jgi:hypothetical protein
MPSSTQDQHSPLINTALTLILIAVLTSTCYTYFQRGVWPGLSDSFDFRVFYTASQVIMEGHTEHLYDIEWFYSVGSQPYQYFPLFAILLSPLALLSFETARIIWMIINQIVLLGSAWIVIKGLLIRDMRIILGIFILMMGFGPMDANMYWGQVNAVIMLCVFAAWWAYKNNRPVLCGVLIALGTLIKITPAILGVYFLYKRSFKVVLGCISGGLGLTLFSILVLGGVVEHVTWFTDMLPFLTGGDGMGKAGQVLNQSFLAMYIRIAEQGFFPVSFAPMLHLISEIGVLLICFAFCRIRRLTPDAPEFDLEFAAITCLMVLMPQTVIVQHYVYVLPAFLILLVFLINNGMYSIPLFICFALAYTMTSLGAFGGPFFSQWPFVIIQSSKLLGVLLIWGTLGYLLFRQRGGISPRESQMPV